MFFKMKYYIFDVKFYVIKREKWWTRKKQVNEFWLVQFGISFNKSMLPKISWGSPSGKKELKTNLPNQTDPKKTQHWKILQSR